MHILFSVAWPVKIRTPAARGIPRGGMGAGLATRGEAPRRTQILDWHCRAWPAQGAERIIPPSIRPRSNAESQDAASFECSGAFASGC
jgi:hypothetical protein